VQVAERPVGIGNEGRPWAGKEQRMVTDEKHDATGKTAGSHRSLLETAWACSIGIMAAYWLA
jgi:hypothetical protein